MKNLIITDNAAVMVNPETLEVTNMDSQRESIRRIYTADEDCHVKATAGDKNYEFDANKGDIIIAFYDNDFPNKVIVVKNDEWLENLETYNKIMQARKEEWAKRNAMNGTDQEPENTFRSI